MTQVRVPEHALDSSDDQLPLDRAEAFKAHDLAEAITALSLVEWLSLPEVPTAPSIRRFTVEAARTVAGYHLPVGLDAWAEEAGAMVVHVIDIWSDRWPRTGGTL